ncbi:hypothetical protein ACLQ24_12495, partial [Micromonospora sp. DT4]|uniref:hypothetical protein n=1 Tax=Micromonospora sp. DT4 TaxID=3393438 RepID=UPI003CE73813
PQPPTSTESSRTMVRLDDGAVLLTCGYTVHDDPGHTGFVDRPGITYAFQASGGAGWEQVRLKLRVCNDGGAALIV